MNGEPAGWCAVEPRTAYIRLKPLVWAGRSENENDNDIWAVTCFIIRNGYRKRGLTYALAQAAVDYARKRGARSLEGYAIITEPGKTITWGELHVGARKVFAAAGFKEITQPSKRRYVMRFDL